MRQRRTITVEGAVQGVGFRPFVHGLATSRGLTGRVRNDSAGVAIEVEGAPAELDGFLEALVGSSPPLARPERVEVSTGEPRGYADFRIEESHAGGGERAIFISPDTASCDACLRELFDPGDRRFRHPFLSCTHCGPRLTIIRDLPYDRPRTTMAGFPMCEACRREYEDPSDRRFHAQPTCCPACGPRLRLLDAEGREVAGAIDDGAAAGPWDRRIAGGGGTDGDAGDAITATAAALREGRIAAVKGLGGYHLACDALNSAAVRRLRERKGREAKPLAVMARNVEAVRALCHLDETEEAILTSPRRPIVLLRERAGARESGSALAKEVAAGISRLGVMLPYTPLHHLLLAEMDRPLVMTSGNRSGEPIVHRDEGARERLAGLADLILTHDRPIHTRCDDSVTQVLAGGEMPLRRSRGYAPAPIRLPLPAGRPTLALGGHLKNTFCLVRDGYAFPGHHVGDLEDPDVIRAFREEALRYCDLFGIRPEIVAHDLHPDYLSTRFAAEIEAAEENARSVGVQHHHAHVAAAMAEHGLEGAVIGVAFDGTGYGTDGAVWGGEWLVADYAGYRRAAHLRYVPLPGGAAAVREPWRMALSHLIAAFGTGLRGDAEIRDAARSAGSGNDADDVVTASGGPLSRVDESRWRAVGRMIRKGVASPPTSSAGRLFDAAAALLGVRTEVHFEAQAAMELEALADPAVEEPYPVELVAASGLEPVSGAGARSAGERDSGGARWIWEPAPVIRGIVSDRRRGRPQAEIAGRFHATVARAVMETCARIRRETGLDRVVLTGGVFQNALLTEKAVAALETDGFDVRLHRRVPSNDGGLALGQAAVALGRVRNGQEERRARTVGASSGSASVAVDGRDLAVEKKVRGGAPPARAERRPRSKDATGPTGSAIPPTSRES